MRKGIRVYRHCFPVRRTHSFASSIQREGTGSVFGFSSSIHVKKPRKGEVSEARESFPIPVPDCEGIYFCGFTDEKAFAASAYFIKNPRGNVLVDSPRFNPALISGFDALGGLDIIFLTHIDDVGDHAKWAKHYDIPRIIHEKDVDDGTKDCEIQLEGDGPWILGEDGDSDEMEIVFTPGHTPGSLCLFHKPTRTMFTGDTTPLQPSWRRLLFVMIGDHFLYSEKNRGFSMLAEYNKDDLSVQLESICKLMDYDFLTMIPGHQRRYVFADPEEKNRVIQDFVNSHKQ